MLLRGLIMASSAKQAGDSVLRLLPWVGIWLTFYKYIAQGFNNGVVGRTRGGDCFKALG